MTIKNLMLAIGSFFILAGSASTYAECYGEGEYSVCSESKTDSEGDIHARSWDTEGNSYHIDTETRSVGNGHEITSSDSEGNEYSIKSWSDSSGAHTVDSEGNSCTITPSGQMIGCD